MTYETHAINATSIFLDVKFLDYCVCFSTHDLMSFGNYILSPAFTPYREV